MRIASAVPIVVIPVRPAFGTMHAVLPFVRCGRAPLLSGADRPVSGWPAAGRKRHARQKKS